MAILQGVFHNALLGVKLSFALTAFVNVGRHGQCVLWPTPRYDKIQTLFSLPPQTFAPTDLAGVAALVLLEALLSADNALVLAIMVKHLPKPLQQKALLYGLAGAFVFRLIAIVFATVVLQQWWLQAIGAAYLLFLPIKHFFAHAQSSAGPVNKGGTFWQTVLAVELTDIAFALDSVLAGIGFITKNGVIQYDKIWVVYLGAIIGIILLRFAAGLFVRLLERYPMLDHMAYVLVGWVGVKLAMHAAEKAHKVGALPFATPHLDERVFWGGLLSIVVVGTYLALRNAKTVDRETESTAELMETTQDGVITAQESAAGQNPQT